MTGRQPVPARSGELTAPIDGDAAFAEVVRRLEQVAIAVTELSLRLPSLDEVFATLTGRPADGETAEEAA
ncbi:MAG: hypothetical protein ACLP8X_37305 [Streptosporangiaceae bacterium]